jgi:hypothetical protein
MKKLLLSSAVLMFLATAAVAQTQKKSEITICKHTENTFTLAELEKCNMLLPIDESVKVKSFVVSLLLKEKTGDVYRDFQVNGNNFSPEVLEVIKSSKDKISKILIENVKVVDAKKNEKVIAGLVINLK